MECCIASLDKTALLAKFLQEDRAHRLMRNLDLLQQDRVFLEQNEQAAVELARSTQAMVAEQLRRMDSEAQAQQVGSLTTLLRF